jgi:lipopolysaccharide export system protein LptA
MTAVLDSLLLGVMLLLDPREVIDAEAAAAVSEDADRVELAAGPVARREGRHSARIRSRSSDFDRKAGVILFEGDVLVEYESDYVMCADRVFAFLSASNRLGRVVAVGHVTITNETRVGTCALATYRRRKGEIEMFGEKGGAKARLVETGDDASEVQGDCIRFWLDSEQVQVERTAIAAEHEGEGKKEDFL